MRDPHNKKSFWDALSETYHQDVISPFSRGVSFRFETDVRRILGRWKRDGTLESRAAVDFGCGCGDALLTLAGSVGIAAGIDLSDQMLNKSQARLEKRGIDLCRLRGPKSVSLLARMLNPSYQCNHVARQTVLVTGNLFELGMLRGRVDLGVSINSICPPTAKQAKLMFDGIARSIKAQGRLILVLPSLDTMYYLERLFWRHHRRPWGGGRINEKEGAFVEPDGFQQKFFTPHEIVRLCAWKGLRIVRMEKIRYPWELMRRFGWGFFPGRPRLWDWYVVADRRNRR